MNGRPRYPWAWWLLWAVIGSTIWIVLASMAMIWFANQFK